MSSYYFFSLEQEPALRPGAGVSRGLLDVLCAREVLAAVVPGRAASSLRFRCLKRAAAGGGPNRSSQGSLGFAFSPAPLPPHRLRAVIAGEAFVRGNKFLGSARRGGEIGS